MQQEELMLGDFVEVTQTECVADGGHYITWSEYGKVIGITDSYIEVEVRDGEYNVDAHEDELKSIPLTSEILKKNEFEKTLDEDDIECYRHYNRAADGYIKITLYDDGNGSWSIEIVNYDKFDDNEIRYKNEFSFLKIHELQHALRLCGINKEIEL